MYLKIAILLLLFAVLALPDARASKSEVTGNSSASVYQLRPYLARLQVVDPNKRVVSWGEMGYRNLNGTGVLACDAGFDLGLSPAMKGVYLWDGSLLTTISEVPAVENDVTYLHPAINDRGDAVYVRWDLINQSPSSRVSIFRNGVSSDLVAVGEEVAPGFVVRILPDEPTINRGGDVALLMDVSHPNGGDTFTIYRFTGGKFVRVIGQGSDAPGGGRFLMNYGPIPRVWLADNGDILFKGYVLGGIYDQMDGLFIVRADGSVEKLEIRGDPLPVGGVVHFYSLGEGSLNSVGDAAFRVRIEHPSISSGVFISSHGTLSTVMYDGQISPLGGPFLSLYHPTDSDPGGSGPWDANPPLINSRGQVLFKAEARDRDGKKRVGLFLGTPACLVKVAAVGDRLPTGGRIVEIDEYSLNEQGQVAMRVRERTAEGIPHSIFLATPIAPEINSIKLKGGEAARLVIKGRGFIINDAVVEIDGQAVGGVAYSDAQASNDGTTRRLIVTGGELSDVLPPGQTVEVTVSSQLIGLRSAPFSFTVPVR